MSELQDLVRRAEELLQAGENEDAFLLLEAAANRADPQAQYLASLMLEAGIGTIQDIERARELCFSAAELGHADAQAQVGGLYALGKGVEVNYETAAFWFDKAARQGSPIALNDLGNMYRQGLFFDKDDDRAITLYELAAQFGGDEGKFNFGCHLVRSDDPKKVSDGITLLEEASENGLAKAQTTLALHLVEGEILERDFERSFRLFEAAAAAGDLDGLVGLGMNYSNGYGCQKDLAKANELFNAAAERGSAQAQFNLAWSLHYESGVARDIDAALKWYSAAAEQGHPGAIRGMGELYELGAGGVLRDLAKAAQLYVRAAQMGDTVAEYNLGVFYEHGSGVHVDRRLAATYLERAANKGHNSAQLNLGLLHQSGIDGVPDYNAAIYWLQIASESGNRKANGAIGQMYLLGQGVEKSTEKAIHHLELSANQGEVYSQYNLALLLRGVNDGPVDEERSAFWLLQAAEQGLGAAEVDLAINYLQGAGVEVDHAEAYKWALLSTSSDDERGEKIRTYCEGNLQEEALEEGRSRAKAVLQSLGELDAP
jgi:TPR repeat protein